MQNRFRFRAWNKNDKEMCYDAEQTYDYMTGKPVIMEESFGCLLEAEEYIVMQCTGLKDVNGNLIYEGDIVLLMGYDKPVRGVVEYSQEYAAFIINVPNKIVCYEFGEIENQGLFVVGNIYEDPELLEKENEPK